MNTPVKRAKSKAIGKQCNPIRGHTKQRKEPFPLKSTEKGYINMILQFTHDFWHWKWGFNAEKGLSSTKNGRINMKR